MDHAREENLLINDAEPSEKQPSRRMLLPYLQRFKVTRLLALLGALTGTALVAGCEEESSEDSQPAEFELQVQKEIVVKKTPVYIEIINRNSYRANAPFQLKELQAAANMALGWQVVTPTKKTKKKATPEGEKPEPNRKIQVSPPEKKDLTGLWHLFYVVDGITIAQIQIHPEEGEPLDVFQKRAMTILFICAFDKPGCEAFNAEKAKDGHFPINPEDFQLRKVYVGDGW